MIMHYDNKLTFFELISYTSHSLQMKNWQNCNFIKSWMQIQVWEAGKLVLFTHGSSQVCFFFVLIKSNWITGNHLTIKPEVSVAAFVRLLLCRLRADGYQTWQEGRGRARLKHGRVCFHGNYHVAMATKKQFYGQISTVVGYKIGCDVKIHYVTSPMTSHVTSPWQWRRGNHLSMWFLEI